VYSSHQDLLLVNITVTLRKANQHRNYKQDNEVWNNTMHVRKSIIY